MEEEKCVCVGGGGAPQILFEGHVMPACRWVGGFAECAKRLAAGPVFFFFLSGWEAAVEECAGGTQRADGCCGGHRVSTSSGNKKRNNVFF